jgi:hypothetical protein
MSPPNIRNSLLSSYSPPSLPEEERSYSPIRLALEDPGGRARELAEQGRNFLTQGLGARYGQRLHQRFGQGSVREIEETLEQGRRWLTNGNSRGYFIILRSLYLLLPHQNPNQLDEGLREFNSVTQNYISYLDNLPPRWEDRRLHLFYSISQVVNSALSWLQNIPESEASLQEVGRQWAPLLQQLLRQSDQKILDSYQRLSESGFENLNNYQGILDQVRLRRAILSGNNMQIREYAARIQDFYAAHPVETEQDADISYEIWGQHFLRQGEYLSSLADLDVPSVAEENSIQLQAVSADLFIQTLLALEFLDERGETEVQRSRAILSTLLTAMVLMDPHRPIQNHWQALLQNEVPRSFERRFRSFLRSNAPFAGMWENIRNQYNISQVTDLWEQGRLLARDLNPWVHGAGRRITQGLLQAMNQHSPFPFLMNALQRHPEIVASLHLPQDPLRAAQELFRRGEAGKEQIQHLAQNEGGIPIAEFEEILNSARDTENFLNNFIGSLMDAWEPILREGTEEELAVLSSLESSLENLATNATLRNRLTSWADQRESLSFRSARILSHLFSGPSLATLGAGVLFAEFAPAFLMGRLGQSTRLGRALAPAGVMGLGGTLANGMATGTILSATGAFLQNRRREHLGFTPHFWRDFGSGAVINGLTMAGAFGAAYGLNRMLRPDLNQSLVLGRAWNRNQLLVRGGSFLTGGSLAWGLGVAHRGIQGGGWHSSWDEAAENYLTMAMFEGGHAGLRYLRRRAALHHELGLPTHALNRRLGGWIVNPNLPTLGPVRVEQVHHELTHSLNRNPALQAHRDAVLSRLGLAEIFHPGILTLYGGKVSQGSTPIWSPKSGLILITPDSVAESYPKAPPTRSGPLLLPASTERVNSPQPADTVLPHEYALKYVGKNIVEDSNPYFAINVGEGQKAQQKVLTRQDFNFLPPEDRRVLSRSGVAVITAQPGGEPSIFVPIEFPNPIWIKQGQEWVKIAPGDPVVPLDPGAKISLSRISSKVDAFAERIPLYDADTSEALEFVWGPRIPELRGEGSPIHLDPGEKVSLGNLTIIRDRGNSVFRIGGAGSEKIQIKNHRAQNSEDWKHYQASDNPILGDVGDTVALRRLLPDSTEYYYLRLDDRQGISNYLPQVKLEMHGQEGSERFSSSTPEIAVGRRSFPNLFDQSYISREHFQLEIVEIRGNPRYVLTVKSPNGLWLENNYFGKGESIPLYSSQFRLFFPTEANSVDPHSADGPLTLTLPPIEHIFPGWNLKNIRPDHNQARRPRPPEIPKRAGRRRRRH